ncbi:hypothetical protein LRP52_46795 [Photobacterium sp. ZSDE20]|nr:hypothetical protein [Photobacterium sp. ZSDE20]
MAVLCLFDTDPATELIAAVTSALTPFSGFTGITLCSVTFRQRASTDLGIITVNPTGYR